MGRKNWNIRGESYVYGKDGSLIRFDSLTDEQKRRAATELKIRMLSAMFPNVKFTAIEQEKTATAE